MNGIRANFIENLERNNPKFLNRVDRIVKRIINSNDKIKVFKELASNGYINRLDIIKELIREINHRAFTELNNILILNPSLKADDFRSHNETIKKTKESLDLLNSYFLTEVNSFDLIKDLEISHAEKDYIDDLVDSLKELCRFDFQYSNGEISNYLKGQKSNTLISEPNSSLRKYYFKVIDDECKLLDSIEYNNPSKINSNLNKLINENIKREIVVIFSSDIIDSTKYADKDDNLYSKIQRENREIHEEIFCKYYFKFKKESGDGYLATFSSTYNAVVASKEIIEKVEKLNSYKIRIGIHLGEIRKEENDIQGLNVTIACRIQSEANPNSIFVSEDVHSNLKNIKDLAFSFVDIRVLKGISDSKRIYQIINDQNIVQNEISVPKQGSVKIDDQKRYPFEYGIRFDANDNAFIGISKLAFFNGRIQAAFPGIRKLTWFTDPKVIIERLELLLRKPLSFYGANLYDKVSVFDGPEAPIWWFRGGSGSSIEKYIKLSDEKCLVDTREFIVDKLAVCINNEDRKTFLYVQAKAEASVFVDNPSSDENLRNEEYAIFNGHIISMEEFDDGSAVINGKVVSTAGHAQLRSRFLRNHNFIICAKSSVFNATEYNQHLRNFLDRMLELTSGPSFENQFEDQLESLLELEIDSDYRGTE